MADEKKPDEADGKKKKGGKKKLIMIVALVLVLAAAAYMVLGKGGGSSSAATPKTTPTPVPGAVVKLDSVNINLAGGHYLQLGIALQATKKAKDTPDGSKALDAAIAQFTDQNMVDLQNLTFREKQKARYLASVEKLYKDEIMDVYFTQFVMQ